MIGTEGEILGLIAARRERRAVRDLPARNDFQVDYLRCRFGATMSLDEPDYNVDSASTKVVCLLQHPDGLPHPRRRTDVDLELAAVAALEQLDKFGSFRSGRLPALYRRSRMSGSLIEVVGHARRELLRR